MNRREFGLGVAALIGGVASPPKPKFEVVKRNYVHPMSPAERKWFVQKMLKIARDCRRWSEERGMRLVHDGMYCEWAGEDSCSKHEHISEKWVYRQASLSKMAHENPGVQILS
jgi:hypothetical protein